jgi:hypothetical protein
MELVSSLVEEISATVKRRVGCVQIDCSLSQVTENKMTL